MEKPADNYWKGRLVALKRALEENNFEVFLCDTAGEAKDLVEKQILPKIDPKSVSWGGSLTFISTGLYDALRNDPNLEILDTFDKTVSGEEKLEVRKRALLVDLFFTGTNAITEKGQLVNLDMYGNRTAAIQFGPANVVVLLGRNKIVPDVTAAMSRVRNYAAPVNAMRLEKKNPCVKTSYCEDCRSADRICNTWTITEKSYPKGRIKVVLINEDMGF